jgi:CelD/BcsL family acetyltransferase involved in cellulose biosynthesis
VTFEWYAPGTVSTEVVDTLLDLHHRLRSGRGQSTSLDAATRQLLHRCVARGSTTLGPAAVVASKGDEIVAVLLGFSCAGWFGAYQSGWDATYAPHSIGSVLVANAIRAVAGAGGHTFDFLRGAEPYKYRFGATDAYDHTYLVPRGPTGVLLRARAALRARRSAPAHH